MDTVEIPMRNTGRFALVDAADAPAVLATGNWSETSQGYAGHGTTRGGVRRHVLMHHLVLGKPPPGLVVDHINRDKLDNRRGNLRFVRRAENAWNIAGQTDSQSGYRGITPSSPRGGWEVRFAKDCRLYLVGRFTVKSGAIFTDATIEGGTINFGNNGGYITVRGLAGGNAVYLSSSLTGSGGLTYTQFQGSNKEDYITGSNSYTIDNLPGYNFIPSLSGNNVILTATAALTRLTSAPAMPYTFNLGSTLTLSAPASLVDAVSLSNSGDTGTILNVTGMSFSGTNSDLFSGLLHSGSTTISQGAASLYNLTFLGTNKRGTYTASVQFATDAQNGPQTATYDLSATVIASALTASPTPGTPFSFGTNLAPSSTATLADAVTLTHGGDAGTTLNIIGVALSGTDASLFSVILSTGSTSLAAGEFAKYTLSFLGSATAGTYTASVLFTTDAQDGLQTATYDLSAIVVAAASDVPGDINRDHIVDQADYTVWYNHYGQTGGNVPEPMTMALLAIGGLAILRRKK